MNGDHRHLETARHESNSTLERQQAAIRGALSFGVDQRAVSLFDEPTHVLNALAETFRLLGKRVGIKQAAGQQVLTGGQNSFFEGSPLGVEISAEESLGHGRGQTPPPGIRKDGEERRRVQVAHMIGYKNNGSLKSFQMFQPFNSQADEVLKNPED